MEPNASQDSVGCGGILNNHFTENLLENLPVEELWKSVKIWHKFEFGHEFGV